MGGKFFQISNIRFLMGFCKKVSKDTLSHDGISEHNIRAKMKSPFYFLILI